MIVTGSGIAKSWTRSKGSPRRSGARRSSLSARMRGSQDAMRRGVKPRFTTLRSVPWSGGSSAIRLRAFGKRKGFMPIRSTKRAMKRAMPNESRGMPSSPLFISTVNIAREENSSGRFSTETASS